MYNDTVSPNSLISILDRRDEEVEGVGRLFVCLAESLGDDDRRTADLDDHQAGVERHHPGRIRLGPGLVEAAD